LYPNLDKAYFSLWIFLCTICLDSGSNVDDEFLQLSLSNQEKFEVCTGDRGAVSIVIILAFDGFRRHTVMIIGNIFHQQI